MTGAALIIDAAYSHVVIFQRRDTVFDETTRVRRGPHLADKFQNRGAQQGGIDTVIDERGLQGKLASCVAGWRGEGSKIALRHRGGRDNRSLIRRSLADCCALITTEEKHLVRDDSPARRSSKLVAFDAVAVVRKRIAGIETAVAHKLEQITMETVRARFRDQTYGTG